MNTEEAVGGRLCILRKRCGLSLRQLADQAGVTAAMISCIERDKNSPSIATLQKILKALGSDIASFFGTAATEVPGPVYPRESMRLVSDAERSYTLIFPKRPDLKLQMLDEQICPARKRPPFETLECAIAGYVITGQLTLEIRNGSKTVLRPGDAFCIPAGTEHRGYAVNDEPARVVTVYTPPRY